MKTLTMLAGLLIALLISPALHAALQEREVDYRAGTTALKGYLVFDDKIAGKRPGVLVVHEFWGLNDYARKRARMLAELGYTALAVDMYGEGKAFDHPKDAMEAMRFVTQNPDLGKDRFLAAKALLAKEPTVDAGKIADCLRCDFLPECHMASTEIRDRRRTLRYRCLLVRQMVQTKNRISGLLMETGMTYNKQRFTEWDIFANCSRAGKK